MPFFSMYFSRAHLTKAVFDFFPPSWKFSRAVFSRFFQRKKKTKQVETAKEKETGYKDVNAEAKLDEFETAADSGLCENLLHDRFTMLKNLRI